MDFGQTNAVSALSGEPTLRILSDGDYRRVVRAIMVEALDVMRAAKIRTARLGPLPVRLFPAVLALPTPAFRAVARAQLAVDPEARSSMWEDLDRRRLTEVDWLNGEIVRVAARSGRSAPINARSPTTPWRSRASASAQRPARPHTSGRSVCRSTAWPHHIC